MTTLKTDISIIFQEERENTVYTLCQINIHGLIKYAVAIANEQGSDFELIDTDRDRSCDFFKKALEFQLSPIHLKDTVRDHIIEFIV